MSGPVDVLGRLATMALHHGEEWEEVHDAVVYLIEAARITADLLDDETAYRIRVALANLGPPS